MSSTLTLAISDQQVERLQQIKNNADRIRELLESPYIKPIKRKNFLDDWKAWSSFIECEPGGMTRFFSIPTANGQASVLQSYVHHLLKSGLKASSVRRRLNGLSTIFRLLEVPDGCRYPLFAFFLKTTLEAVATPAEQAPAMQVGTVNSIRDSADPNGEILKFRAALIVQLAYDTVCRGSELLEMRQADITYHKDGTGLIFIRRSKSDQMAIGTYRSISRSTVAMLKIWLKKVNSVGRFEYVLCPVHAKSNMVRKLNKDPKKPTSIEKPIAYRRLLSDIKLFGAHYSAHSTRVGAVLDMIAEEKPTTKIQLAGGWKSPSMIGYYGRKSQAKSGAMAELAEKFGR